MKFLLQLLSFLLFNFVSMVQMGIILAQSSESDCVFEFSCNWNY